MSIKFFDIQKQYEHCRLEVDAQIRSVLDEGAFIMGRQVHELEDKLSDYVGVKFAVACASGTQALQLALMVHGVKPGDEIITTPFTFIATVENISLLGAKPVFVDVRRDTFNIDPKKIEQAIGPNTKGIIAVNIFGQCADLDEINRFARSKGLFVIEDAAQSFGSRYNGKMSCSLSDLGCTSFFPAKPFGCYGDGGMLFLNDKHKADILKSLCVHGAGDSKYEHVRIGMNARLDTLQAAILLAKFKHFPYEIESRNRIADYYSQQLSGMVETPVVLPSNHSVFAQYNVLVDNREDLRKCLHNEGVPTAVYYPIPLHLQTALSGLAHQKGDFPVAEYICSHILAIPMHPFLSQEQQDFIIEKIKKWKI